jgi:hypothetical protein
MPGCCFRGSVDGSEGPDHGCISMVRAMVRAGGSVAAAAKVGVGAMVRAGAGSGSRGQQVRCGQAELLVDHGDDEVEVEWVVDRPGCGRERRDVDRREAG